MKCFCFVDMCVSPLKSAAVGCFPSIEHFSCENADEQNLNSLLICLFKNSCTLFLHTFFFPRNVLTNSRLLY